MPLFQRSTLRFSFVYAILLLCGNVLYAALNLAQAVDVNQLVNDSAPAIVQVQGIRWVKVKIPEQYKDITDDPVYRSLSSILMDNQTPNQTRAAPVIKKQINGSGFVISAQGQIATNYQWIKDTHEIIVILADKRVFKANMVRSDAKNDLAIIRIHANNLPVLSLADRVEEGEGVIAVGAHRRGTSVGVIVSTPAQTPASGLVSDVNVNADNSGGPLLNTSGQVLGLNSTRMQTTLGLFRHPRLAKLSSDGFDDGTHTFNSLSNLGFSARDMSKEQSAALGLTTASGAMVLQVRPGSMAGNAGLLKNDVIVSLESQGIVEAADLNALPDFLRQDNQARLTVMRAGAPVEVQLVSPKLNSAIASWSWRKLGLRTRPLTTAQKNAANIASGVLVIEVQGDALNNGLQAGDWIISVNQIPLNTVAQLNQLAQDLQSGDSVVVYLVRGELRQFVSLTAHE